jgi:hypothetical protein
MDQGIADFLEVVGGDVGGHPHGDPRSPVDQQLGRLRRQHHRLPQRTIKIVHPLHRLLLQIRQQLLRHRRQPRLGIPHRRRRIPIHRPEVPLPVHQGVAHGEVLGHPGQGLIHRHIPVGVELAQHLPHDAGRLLVRGVRMQPHLVHHIQNAPLHRLQPVPHVRQRPRHNHTHRVVQISRFELLLDLHLDHVGRRHGSSLSCRGNPPSASGDPTTLPAGTGGRRRNGEPVEGSRRRCSSFYRVPGRPASLGRGAPPAGASF